MSKRDSAALVSYVDFTSTSNEVGIAYTSARPDSLASITANTLIVSTGVRCPDAAAQNEYDVLAPSPA